MDRLVLNSIKSLESKGNFNLETLLSSEAFYWLSTAVALNFARDIILSDKEAISDGVVARFTMTLRENQTVSDTAVKVAQEDCFRALEDIYAYLKECYMFNRKKAIAVCKGFTHYWLFTKLIELEWQKKLEQEDMVETYLFLDGVIADEEELSFIEEKIKKEDTLFDDEVIYLRTHFRNAYDYFFGLGNELKLISLGHISLKR